MDDLHISTPPAGGSRLKSLKFSGLLPDSLWTRLLAPSAEDVFSTTLPSTSHDTGWGRHHNDRHRTGHRTRGRNHNQIRVPFYSPTGEI